MGTTDRWLVMFILNLVYKTEEFTLEGDMATYKYKGKDTSTLYQRVIADGDEFLFSKETFGNHDSVIQVSDNYVRIFNVKRTMKVIVANGSKVTSSGTNRQIPFAVVKGEVSNHRMEDFKHTID